MKDLTTHPAEKLIAMDIMKAFAVFFMFLGHIVIMYGSPKVIGSTAITWIAFCVEGIGAPAFIFAMGLSIVLASQKSPRQVWMRGLSLILTGYILNFLKFFPTISLFHIFPEELFHETGRLNNTAGLFSFLFIADILQFAGIAYIICAFFRRYVRRYQLWALALALPLLVLAPYLYLPEYASNNYLVQLVYGQNYQVYFPLFPWMAFPFLGMVAGYYISMYDLRQVMVRFLIFGLFFLSVGLYLISSDFSGQFGADYYHRKHGALIMYCGELFAVLSMLYFLTPYLSSGLIKAMRFCSRNVTRIYILQWVLIYWGWAFTPYGTLQGTLVVPYLLFFIALTMVLTAGWEYLGNGKQRRNKTEGERSVVKTG